VYNAEYKILICITCESIILQKSTAYYRHLNEVHRITGPLCKALLAHFAAYDLCPFEELPAVQERVAPIPGLKVQDGFRCHVCSTYFTICKCNMHDHISMHKLGVTPKQAWEMGKYTSSWCRPSLQPRVESSTLK
jgi:hypothetical protein